MPGDVHGRPHLSVVIPAYNEERRLGDSLAKIFSYLDASVVHAEVLVVDDGSTDGTAGLARKQLQGRAGRVLSSPENRGKGHAVRRGVLAAAGRWILLTDTDLSTPIDEHASLAAVARDQDADVVIGSRALRESKVEVRQHPVREAMGKTFNLLMRATTGLPFHDTQCGFKLMDRTRVLPLFEKMVVEGFAFDVELLFLCTRFGLVTREVPVVWRNASGSQVSMVTDPVRMLMDVVRVRWRFRRGLYNPDVQPPGEADAEG